MSTCMGCYREGFEGYCLTCRKSLFDGARVPAVLDFDAPDADNLAEFQERTKRLSISGVQLKYSLRLEGKKLVLTEKGGQYILKPVPPVTTIAVPDQAPENEHLTMQIASRIFGIPVAANAFIQFKDGAPAYLTRRFDVRADGTKFLQEDMAQISGRSRQTGGENFKYDGTYEEIGLMIGKHVAAAAPALENYFRLLLFNYLFSNGDAHLKNFSLYQTAMGDYALTPAYDLMSTVLHMPNESDTALDFYPRDYETEFFSVHGYFGKPDFRILADKIGILPIRRERIFNLMTSKGEMVIEMIGKSFLREDVKKKYRENYEDKLTRLFK